MNEHRSTGSPPELSSIQKIWLIVAMIPQGRVTSYGLVADYAGLPGRARLVSKALKSAPDELQLPWHRVINSQGKISLQPNSPEYREQVELLRIEDISVNRGKVALSKYQWQPDLATLVMAMPF